MSVTYIHYGSDKFDKNLFEPIRKRFDDWNKPLGGLWASREGDKDGWKQWSIDNEFHEDRLEHSFTFTLKPSANVVSIYKPKDVDILPRLYTENPYTHRNFIPDFEECVRRGIDAIEIVDIYGMDDSNNDFLLDSVYYKLYGWDINSILILNPDIVEVEE